MKGFINSYLAETALNTIKRSKRYLQVVSQTDLLPFVRIDVPQPLGCSSIAMLAPYDFAQPIVVPSAP